MLLAKLSKILLYNLHNKKNYDRQHTCLLSNNSSKTLQLLLKGKILKYMKYIERMKRIYMKGSLKDIKYMRNYLDSNQDYKLNNYCLKYNSNNY